MKLWNIKQYILCIDIVNLYIKSLGFTKSMSDSKLNHLYKCLKSPGQGTTGRIVTSLQLEKADLEREIEVLTEFLERHCQQDKAYMIEILEMEAKEVEQWLRRCKLRDDECIKWEQDKLKRKKNN